MDRPSVKALDPAAAGPHAWPGVGILLEKLYSAGHRVFVVGGAVRDFLAGERPQDVDLLTDAGPDQIARIFKGHRVRYVGKSFAVSLVDGVEVASGRGGGLTEADGGFPGDDLALRDLTFNSMALDPFGPALTDPYGGHQDLANRIIRFTLDPAARIQEDPVRMIRACRFAARYHGAIEPSSLAAITGLRDLLSGAAPERIRTELLKAMALDRPSLFFSLLHDTGLLALILPCLDRCFGLDGGPYHGETVFDHCLMVGDALSGRRPLFRLAGYLHDAGKFDAAVVKEGRLTFAGHEAHTDAVFRDLSALRFSNQEKAYILSLIQAHMRPLNDESTPRAVRRLLAMLAELNVDVRDFLRLRIADKKSNLAKAPYTLSQLRVRLGKIKEALSPQAAFSINDLALSGNEICGILGISPGPEVGRIKALLFEQVLADPSLNTPENLAELVRQMDQ